MFINWNCSISIGFIKHSCQEDKGCQLLNCQLKVLLMKYYLLSHVQLTAPAEFSLHYFLKPTTSEVFSPETKPTEVFLCFLYFSPRSPPSCFFPFLWHLEKQRHTFPGLSPTSFPSFRLKQYLESQESQSPWTLSKRNSSKSSSIFGS